MNLIIAAIAIILLWPQKLSFAMPVMKELQQKGFIKFSLQSFIVSILFTLLLRCDYWIVAWYCNSKEIGNYLQTSKFVQLVMLLPSLASFTVFPLIVQAVTNETNIEIKLVRLMKIYIYISAFLCLLLSVAGSLLFPVIYGNTYNEMYKIFLLLIPGLIAFTATYPLTPYFSAKKLITKNISGMILAIIILVI